MCASLTSTKHPVRTGNRNRKTFDLRRGPKGVSSSVVGLRRDSAITYEISGSGACAEKRMTFRCLSKRHLSVVFSLTRKTVG